MVGVRCWSSAVASVHHLRFISVRRKRGTSGNVLQAIGSLNFKGQDYVDAARAEFWNSPLPDKSPPRFKLWK